MMEEAQHQVWYCVRSQPKKERLAAAQITALYGLETFAPRIRFRRKTVRGAIWFEEAMFPGYLFVRCNLSAHKRAVAAAPGVLHIPQFNGRVASLSDEVIETLRSELDQTECRVAMQALAAGDQTTILSGSMMGLQVEVIQVMPAEERVRVLIDLLGRAVEVEFPTEALEQRRVGVI